MIQVGKVYDADAFYSYSGVQFANGDWVDLNAYPVSAVSVTIAEGACPA